MDRTWTGDLGSHVGEHVRIAGWLHHQRRLGQVSFLLLRDRAGIAQIVAVSSETRRRCAELGAESVLEVTGRVAANDQAPGGYEIHDPEIVVISEPDAPPPFELRRAEIPAQLPTLLDHAAIALRHPRRRAAVALSAASVHGFRSTLDALDFTEIHTPKVVASATEGGANVFPIDWFGRTAYLAQSPQFYKQTMVGVLERVYEVGPVFRAEPHDTARHLAEYVSLDAEMGFIADHTDVMRVLRDVIAGMVEATADRVRDLSLPVVPPEIPALPFDEALQLVGADGGQLDLTPANERAIGAWARRQHGSELVYVVGYPMAKRPFYTHPSSTRPGASNSFDLLFRGVELVTGGQRLHRYQDYLHALDGRDIEPYAGYLEAFRHGMPPHGGFAIGLERWVAGLVGAANVREVTLFPRDLHRLTP